MHATHVHTHILHLCWHQTEMEMIVLVECCMRLSPQQDHLVRLRLRQCKVGVGVLYIIIISKLWRAYM